MNRSDLGLLAIFPVLLYSTFVAVGSVSALTAAAAVGLLTAFVPILGLLRREVGGFGFVPGLYLGLALFTTSGITVNDFPGVFGDLLGGWALGAPVFLGLLAVYARDSTGARIFLVVLALLASAAVLSVATGGPFGTSDSFGLLLAQIPRTQANTLGVVLSGGAPERTPVGSMPLADVQNDDQPCGC